MSSFHSIGWGSAFARCSPKKLHRNDLDANSVTTAVIQALYDAADDDPATGGPDVARQIYPVIMLSGSDSRETAY